MEFANCYLSDNYMEGGVYNKKLFFLYYKIIVFILQKIIFHIKLGTYNQWFWTTLFEYCRLYNNSSGMHNCVPPIWLFKFVDKDTQKRL